MTTYLYPPLRNIQISLIKYSHRMPGSRWEHGVINRNRYALIWAVDGPEALVAEVDGKVVAMPTGALLLLRPGINWSLENRRDAGRPAGVAELWFDFRLPPHGWPPPEKWPLLVTLPASSTVIPLFRYALTLASCEEPERTALVQHVFPLLLMMVLTGRHSQFQPEVASLPEPLERIWQVVRQVGSMPGERSPRLPDLARQAGVSTGHLTHLFSRHLGISPREFMLGLRLEHAASLLAGSPSLSIKEIARMTGFCDQFHFSRQFSVLFGCAPKHYREMPMDRRPVVSVLDRLKSAIPEPLQIPSYASADLKQRAGGVKATATRLLRELRHELAANRTPFAFPATGTRRWRPFVLAPFATRSRQVELDGMFGPATRSPHLPAGTLRAHGIPFVLPEEKNTGGRSVITLRSNRLHESSLPASVVLPLNCRTAGIGILHACAWTQSQRMTLGEYEIHYADHARVVLPVVSRGWDGTETGRPELETDPGTPVLQDYWPDNPQFDSFTSRKFTVIDPQHALTSVRYLYVFWWENPRPDVPVRRLILRSRPDASGLLVILGVTLLAAPVRRLAAAVPPSKPKSGGKGKGKGNAKEKERARSRSS